MVAAVNGLLWRRGRVPLLRDTLMALVHAGRADAAAEATWQALQQGEEEMVAGVAAAVIRSGSAREAAELAGQLAAVSGSSPQVAEVLGEAVAAAVRAGSVEEAAATSAQLLHQGHQPLLREVVAALMASGGWQRQQQLRKGSWLR